MITIKNIIVQKYNCNYLNVSVFKTQEELRYITLIIIITKKTYPLLNVSNNWIK